jgi:hypothetical protein
LRSDAAVRQLQRAEERITGRIVAEANAEADKKLAEVRAGRGGGPH